MPANWRRRTFKLNLEEMNERHHLTFDTYEDGKTHAGRIFRSDGLLRKATVHSGSVSEIHVRPVEALSRDDRVGPPLKARYGLKIVVVSNEARELNSYRIRKFKLDEFVDFFISSCFVHLRKPDAESFGLRSTRTGSSQAGSLYRKHTDVRPDCGRFGDSKYSSHGLQVHVRETGFVRIGDCRMTNQSSENR